jgi:hypothetical protein
MDTREQLKEVVRRKDVSEDIKRRALAGLDEVVLIACTGKLLSDFIWRRTKEGDDFWDELYKAPDLHISIEPKSRIDEYIKHVREYNRLHELGLVGVSTNRVQLTVKEFMDVFGPGTYSGEILNSGISEEKYIRVEQTVDGITFVALT